MKTLSKIQQCWRKKDQQDYVSYFLSYQVANILRTSLSYNILIKP